MKSTVFVGWLVWCLCLVTAKVWCKKGKEKDSRGPPQSLGSVTVSWLLARWPRLKMWKCPRGRIAWRVVSCRLGRCWLRSTCCFRLVARAGKHRIGGFSLPFGPGGCWSWTRKWNRYCFRWIRRFRCLMAFHISWYRPIWGLFILRSCLMGGSKLVSFSSMLICLRLLVCRRRRFSCKGSWLSWLFWRIHIQEWMTTANKHTD